MLEAVFAVTDEGDEGGQLPARHDKSDEVDTG